MIIQFTPTELANLVIQPAPPRATSPAYREEREQVWRAQMEAVQARGGKMWNGAIYTLEGLHSPAEGQVVLRMGQCEYKDLIFRSLKGLAYVTGRYGEPYQFPFTGVSCVPLTRDGKYVFGIRADRAEPVMGGIGGNLNSDEVVLHTFTDIRQAMLNEIHEETALECAAEDPRFFGLHVSDGMHLFLFTWRLPVHSADIPGCHRPGEFSQLVAITRREAEEMTLPTTGAFKRWLPYLPLLPQAADGER